MKDNSIGGSGIEIEGALSLVALGERVRAERVGRRMSLEGLAERAGVSRSMLSAVETGGKAPTVLTLHRIASGLGVSMSRLLGEERAEPVVVLRREQQSVARDPSGWERRNLAPPLPGREVEFMRTEIPAGVDAGTFPPHRSWLARVRRRRARHPAPDAGCDGSTIFGPATASPTTAPVATALPIPALSRLSITSPWWSRRGARDECQAGSRVSPGGSGDRAGGVPAARVPGGRSCDLVPGRDAGSACFYADDPGRACGAARCGVA